MVTDVIGGFSLTLLIYFAGLNLWSNVKGWFPVAQLNYMSFKLQKVSACK